MVRDSYGVGVWKAIGKQWDIASFKTKVSFAMGSESRV